MTVVGGGLAGISAALHCADAGRRVTLLEVRPRLGGAAYSFERDGLRLDNGQHVFLRCCTEYLALLDRLGARSLVTMQPRLEIPVIAPGGRIAWLRRSGLPAPLHLAGAIARYRHLGPLDRARAASAALALSRVDPDDPRSDTETFARLAGRPRQRPQAIEALWDLIARPTLNLPAAEASLALAARVFQIGLLSRDRRRRHRMGHRSALRHPRRRGASARSRARASTSGSAARVTRIARDDAGPGLDGARARRAARVRRGDRGRPSRPAGVRAAPGRAGAIPTG